MPASDSVPPGRVHAPRHVNLHDLSTTLYSTIAKAPKRALAFVFSAYWPARLNWDPPACMLVYTRYFLQYIRTQAKVLKLSTFNMLLPHAACGIEALLYFHMPPAARR